VKQATAECVAGCSGFSRKQMENFAAVLCVALTVKNPATILFDLQMQYL